MDARINSILEQKGIHADGDGLHLLPPDQLAQSQRERRGSDRDGGRSCGGGCSGSCDRVPAVQ